MLGGTTPEPTIPLRARGVLQGTFARGSLTRSSLEGRLGVAERDPGGYPAQRSGALAAGTCLRLGSQGLPPSIAS